ncbi:MAG TPA: hypothetical protein VJX67_06475 [Blastocatellia bacterium]|nr:hypothetical protein [Blastocatellia bacterium]
MTNTGWSLVNGAARLLSRDEREAVLGDLMEGTDNVWQGLLAVLGLVIRRQTILWKSWRPWLAGFGLAWPSSLLLMGVSLSVSWRIQHLTRLNTLNSTSTALRDGLPPLMCQLALLIAWSWTGGFVVGAVSRRTVWVSALLCTLPCLFCLARFREPSLSRLSLLLFLVPAIVGVWSGVRGVRIKPSLAGLIAATVTVLMLAWWSSKGLPALNWALMWPAWYIVAAARRSDHGPRPA